MAHDAAAMESNSTRMATLRQYKYREQAVNDGDSDSGQAKSNCG